MVNLGLFLGGFVLLGTPTCYCGYCLFLLQLHNGASLKLLSPAFSESSPILCHLMGGSSHAHLSPPTMQMTTMMPTNLRTCRSPIPTSNYLVTLDDFKLAICFEDQCLLSPASDPLKAALTFPFQPCCSPSVPTPRQLLLH